MKITFLLLAHQKPNIVTRFVNILVRVGYSVVIHYDLKSPSADYMLLAEAFADNPHVRFARRVRVGWGEWSIVAATLNCIKEIEASEWNPDYIYYASGADYPIRGATELEAFLARNFGKEFIEGVPANSVKWVKGGPQAERYQYYFFFNWRTYPKLGKFLLAVQKALRLKRRFVLGMEPYIGSQWWVLTWKTLQDIMETARRPDVIRFFRTTLIPDETFFQTLVFNLIPRSKIVERHLTLYQFTDYMVPVVFCADRLDYLLRQPFFMARKLSSHRMELYDALDACWRGERNAEPFDDLDIGIISPEYETNRLAWRDGAADRPLPGYALNSWAGGLERTEKPYFAVIGMSVAELRLAHMLLSGHKGLRCHGQLFHPACVEFAPGVTSGVGDGLNAVLLRNLSAPNFLADIIRMEPVRQLGFLLRFGQGWHIPEVMFNQPTAKVLILHGDPLIGFIESLSVMEPLLEHLLGSEDLRSIPPRIIVRKFEQYEQHAALMKAQLDKLVIGSRPKGKMRSWAWLTELELDVASPSRVNHRGAQPTDTVAKDWRERTLERWRDWAAQAEICLGVNMPTQPDNPIWTRLANDLTKLHELRQFLLNLLAAGGYQTPILDATETGNKLIHHNPV